MISTERYEDERIDAQYDRRYGIRVECPECGYTWEAMVSSYDLNHDRTDVMCPNCETEWTEEW